jgi:hypothetical protein
MNFNIYNLFLLYIGVCVIAPFLLGVFSMWCSNQLLVISIGLGNAYKQVGGMGMGLGIASGLLSVPMGIGIFLVKDGKI